MTHNPTLLLLEDDRALNELITEELETDGWTVFPFFRLADARSWLNDHATDLVVSDLRLPDGDGMSLVHELTSSSDTKQSDSPGIVIITAFGSVPQAVEALQAGADEFLTKPVDLDHLLLTVQRVQETRQTRAELEQYRNLSRENGFHGLVGDSQPARELFNQIRIIGRTGGSALILGESGTGKELVAKALCAESDRADAPFITVNCAGIPRDLMESEFFGHTANAFTGAGKARQGLFQQADGGTLFLDEIAEMPLPLQAKLLRALQDGSIRPLGQDGEETVDVRIIAATHQNLTQRVAQSEFREDLYYRLETFTVRVPPLRERRDDIELLADRFLAFSSLRQDRRIRGFSLEAMKLLCRYPFPGNVRELQNVIERAVAFCETERIQIQDLPDRIRQKVADNRHTANTEDRGEIVDDAPLPAIPNPSDMLSLEEVQKRYVRQVVNAVHGNKRQAAAILGIGRRTLYRWLEDAANEDSRA